MQFYKILGSSDLIGNPIGLVDKVGRGVLEFVGEPAKGLLKGPKEFVGGVNKGMKSLTSNVVGGSMESVSKITGSLYGVLRSVGGDVEGEDRLSRPDTALKGFGQGIKGGISDLGEGLAGIFTKPIKGAKQQGGKGFVKGVGKGLVGAITSPFSAVLRVGNNVSAGISAQASETKSMTLATRFRFPRYFGPRLILEEYDEKLSEAQACLYSIEKGKYANQTMLKTFDLQIKGQNDKDIAIFTESDLLVIRNYTKILKSINLAGIYTFQLLQKQQESQLIIQGSDKKFDITIKNEFTKLQPIHEFLQNLNLVNLKEPNWQRPPKKGLF